MKLFQKSNSSLNNYLFERSKSIVNKDSKFPISFINIKKRKHILVSLYLNSDKFNLLNQNDNHKDSINISLLKNPICSNNITLRKTRNTATVRDLLKSKSNIDLFQKLTPNNITKKDIDKKKQNYLLLTSLYNLPKIKKTIKLNKKIYFNSCTGENIKNDYTNGPNTSTTNSKSIFNESLTSSNERKIINSMNLLNNNESIISNSKVKFQKKKRLLSTLSSLLKNKYYSDTEKLLENKITKKSFPSDYSMRDKVIHMKKVGIFWDSVFKYCVPIINVDKFKAQRELSERKRLNFFNLNMMKSKYNYYDMMAKQSISFRKNLDKNLSQPKLNSHAKIK